MFINIRIRAHCSYRIATVLQHYRLILSGGPSVHAVRYVRAQRHSVRDHTGTAALRGHRCQLEHAGTGTVVYRFVANIYSSPESKLNLVYYGYVRNPIEIVGAHCVVK